MKPPPSSSPLSPLVNLEIPLYTYKNKTSLLVERQVGAKKKPPQKETVDTRDVEIDRENTHTSHGASLLYTPSTGTGCTASYLTADGAPGSTRTSWMCS